MNALGISAQSNHEISINLKPHYITYFDHCLFLGHYSIAFNILEMGGWHSFVNGNFMLFLREKVIVEMRKEANHLANMTYGQMDTFRINELPHYQRIVGKLYSMGADIDNIYKNRVLRGFPFFYDVIAESNDIFESRQVALTKILQRYLMMDFDVCFIIVSFVPYINAKMIQRLQNEKGMVLKGKKNFL